MVCWSCHFDTRDKFLKEAHRVLKPGGSLALSDMLFPTTILSEFGQVPRANLLPSIAEYCAPPCRSRLRLNRGDGRDWALPPRVSRQLGSLGRRGAPRRAHEIIAKPCRGDDLQAVGRLFRLELQDLSAGLGAQAILSATMGTFFTFLLPYEHGPSFIFYDG